MYESQEVLVSYNQVDFVKGEITLPPHPEAVELRDPHWLVSVIPVLGISVMAVFYLLRSTADSANSALFAVPLLLLAVFTVIGTIAANRWRKRDHERQNTEKTLGYVRLMHSKLVRLQAAQDSQRAILQMRYAPINQLLYQVLSQEHLIPGKHANDPLSTHVRLGIGRIPLMLTIHTPDPDQNRENSSRAFRLANSYRFVDDAPVILSLKDHTPIGVFGSRDNTLAVVRTIICQLVATHNANNLRIVLVAPDVEPEDWDWARWLSHTGHGKWLAFDADIQRDTLARINQQYVDYNAKAHRIADEPDHTLIVFDNVSWDTASGIHDLLTDKDYSDHISSISISSNYAGLPNDCRTIVDVHDDATLGCIGKHDNKLSVVNCQAETISPYDARLLVRALSYQQTIRQEHADDPPSQIDFLDMYNVDHVNQLQRLIHLRWQRDLQSSTLPFPVPVGRENLVTDLFLQLSDEHHGPHGVLAGTTGSGKSELLQTLVTSFAIEHHPNWLNFLLIDFKGGSTFELFKGLPHTVGTVTNLDGSLIRRVLDALASEIDARQRKFKRLNVRDIRQYHRYHGQDTDAEPIPHLLIIIDEFAQLAREMPDFLSELVRIAQIGRSLGLHLILATQSPMDIITDEINANLQFRICLRVQTADASRTMLRRPDAAYIPASNVGRGFLQVGESGFFKHFQTAYLGSDYAPQSVNDDYLVLEIVDQSSKTINLLPDAHQHETVMTIGEPYTMAHAIVDSLRDYCTRHEIAPAAPLLLPPLEQQVDLSTVFAERFVGGWNGQDWSQPIDRFTGSQVAIGNAPIGIVDNVTLREQAPLWIQLNAQTQQLSTKMGHVLIIGGPNSGKTVAIQTIALSQAILHSPDDLHMYFLSFSDTQLASFAQQLPHAERVIHGTESERVRRLFGRLTHIMQQRETGRSAAEPTIILFMDQYEQFRDMYFEQHMAELDRICSQGRSANIFLIMTTTSIGSISERMRSLIQQRIMLRVSDPTDYIIGIGAQPQQVVQDMMPGRALIANNPPLPCQISLPIVTIEDLEETKATLDLFQLMQLNYQTLRGRTQSPLPIDELPSHLAWEDLPRQNVSEELVTIQGYRDDDYLGNFILNWQSQGPDFVVTGPPSSGKTNLLISSVLSAAQISTPDKLQFVLVDFSKRSFTELSKLKHVIAHITDVETLAAIIPSLQTRIAQSTSVVIIFDNYDMISEATGGDSTISVQLRSLVRNYSADNKLFVWLSSYLEHSGDPLLRHLLMQRAGFAFGSKEHLYGFNVRTNELTNKLMPPGRAFFIQYSTIETVQIGFVDNTARHVAHINDLLWQGHVRADKLAVHDPSASSVELPENNSHQAGIDIDTAGLLEDLLNNHNDNNE